MLWEISRYFCTWTIVRFDLPLCYLPRENREQTSTSEPWKKNCCVALLKPKSTLRLSCFLWWNFLKQCPKSFDHLNRSWWDGSSWSLWISGYFSVIFLFLNNYQVTWSRRHSGSKGKTTGLGGRKPGEWFWIRIHTVLTSTVLYFFLSNGLCFLSSFL